MNLSKKIKLKTIANMTIFIVMLSQIVFNGGSSLIFNNLISLLSAVPFLLYVFIGRRKVMTDINTSLYFILSLFFVISILWRPFTGEWLRLKTYTMVPVFLIILYNLIKWSSGLNSMINAFIVGVVVNFIFYIGEFQSDFMGSMYIGRRFVGTLLHFNMAALFYVMTIITLSLYFEAVDRKKKALFFLVILMASILTFATGSKKGIIILVLALFVFYYMLSREVKLRLIRNSIYLIPLAFIVMPFILKGINFNEIYDLSISRFDKFADSLSNLFQSSENGTLDQSTSERIYLMKTAFLKFWQSPLFGHGVDSFYFYNRLEYYSHNNYLELLFNGGIIAFILYYTRYLVLFQKILKLEKKSVIAFSVIMIIILLVEVVDVTVYKKIFQYMILLIWLVVDEKFEAIKLKRSDV